MSEAAMVQLAIPELSQLPTPEALREIGPKVLLKLPLALEERRAEIVDGLSQGLPEYRVFVSGRKDQELWITALKVVETSAILERRNDIRKAILSYIHQCIYLVEAYREGHLPKEWKAQEHGEHCRFTHHSSKQVVEAPLEAHPTGPGDIDPYFLAEYIHSTPGLGMVAALLQHDFHDTARILEVLTD